MELIALLAGFAGIVGGVVSTLVTQGVQRRWTRADKGLERDQARIDKHHDDLRLAYAEYISTSNLLVDRGFAMMGIVKACEEIYGEAYEEAQRGGLNARTCEEEAKKAIELIAPRSRQASEDFLASASAAEAKYITLLLIEDSPQRHAAIRGIAIDELKGPESRVDEQRFVEDLKTRRQLIRALTATLAGEFAPVIASPLQPPMQPRNSKVLQAMAAPK